MSASGDGSAFPIGYDDLVSGSGGGSAPRRPPRADHRAGLASTGDRSSARGSINDHQAAAAAAVARVNSGAAASDRAAPAHDPDGLLEGAGAPFSGGTWADPASLER